VARRAFNLHLMLTLWVISEKSINLDEQYSSDEHFTLEDEKALKLAERLMQEEGMIKVGESCPLT